MHYGLLARDKRLSLHCRSVFSGVRLVSYRWLKREVVGPNRNILVLLWGRSQPQFAVRRDAWNEPCYIGCDRDSDTGRLVAVSGKCDEQQVRNEQHAYPSVCGADVLGRADILLVALKLAIHKPRLLFGYSNVNLVAWSPMTNAWDTAGLNGSPCAVRLGCGYWARFPCAGTLTSVGTTTDKTTPFAIALNATCNQIGDWL